MVFAICERTVESFPPEYEIYTLSRPNSETASLIKYLAWIIHGVAVKVAESHIVTIF
jgi:hypothetical protein